MNNILDQQLTGAYYDGVIKSMDLLNNLNEILDHCRNYREPVIVSNKEDTLSAYNYIKNVLNAPMAAQKLKNEVKEKLMYISKNPTHRPLVYDKHLASLGYRLISVKNYLIFYIINDDGSHIKIIRFFILQKRFGYIY
jgi:toxin ParE1/3/4